MRRPPPVKRFLRFLLFLLFYARIIEILRGRPTGGEVRMGPLSRISVAFANGGNLSRARAVCAACEPLTDSLRSLESGSRERGPGVSGGYPLAEHEAAPHARVARRSPRNLPSAFPANSFRIAFCPLTPAPLSPCFHPHSDCSLRHRCLLVFSFQGVLPSLRRSDGLQSPGFRRSAATSQSPQLGAFAYSAKSNP
jgi:hypothetical protein